MKDGKIKVWLPAIRTGTGSDVFTIRLAQALAQRGMDTEISWFPLIYELAPFLLQGIAVPAGTDIIFANSWNGFAFKRSGIPLVVISFHPEFTSRNSHFSVAQYIYHCVFIRQYEKRSFRAADYITAISEYTASSLKESPHAHKVKVIHLWIDSEKFSPQQSCSNAIKPFRLLFVGTQSYRKGADLLPAIMQNLGSDFHLDIVGKIGDGQQENSPANISCLGRLSDEELICGYAKCDALLFPSRWEGFGYTALEAMACGKPVVTSHATALPEVVVDGVTGLLCQSGDVAAFATACRRLAADSELSRSLGQAGRRRAVDHFSEHKLVSQYVNLIEKLITA